MGQSFQQETEINRNFEIVLQGKKQLTSPNSAGSSTNTSITHSLTYKPVVFAFVAFSSNGTRFPLPYLSVHLTGGAVTNGLIDYQVSYELVDNNTITFYHRDIASASNVTDYIFWYLCREKVNVT